MSKRSVVQLLAVIIVFAAGMLFGHLSRVPAASAQEGTRTVSLDEPSASNPVVSCAPCNYTTEMEDDPFDSTKIRRTRTKVNSVVAVYADGTTKVLKVPGN